jgi:hypothetical protein
LIEISPPLDIMNRSGSPLSPTLLQRPPLPEMQSPPRETGRSSQFPSCSQPTTYPARPAGHMGPPPSPCPPLRAAPHPQAPTRPTATCSVGPLPAPPLPPPDIWTVGGGGPFRKIMGGGRVPPPPLPDYGNDAGIHRGSPGHFPYDPAGARGFRCYSKMGKRVARVPREGVGPLRKIMGGGAGVPPPHQRPRPDGSGIDIIPRLPKYHHPGVPPPVQRRPSLKCTATTPIRVRSVQMAAGVALFTGCMLKSLSGTDLPQSRADLLYDKT